jgi:hypothetical protein
MFWQPKLAEIANGPQSKQKPRQPPKRHLLGMVGVSAVLMFSAVSARAQVPMLDNATNALSTLQDGLTQRTNGLMAGQDDQASQGKDVTLTPEGVISFDGSPFHIFGRDPCPTGYSHQTGCLRLNAPERTLRVVLVPTHNKTNPVSGVIRVGGFPDGQWNIQLLSLEGQDGAVHPLPSEPAGVYEN